MKIKNSRFFTVIRAGAEMEQHASTTGEDKLASSDVEAAAVALATARVAMYEHLAPCVRTPSCIYSTK